MVDRYTLNLLNTIEQQYLNYIIISTCIDDNIIV